MWPRFQLTPAEAKYSGLYEDPRRTQQRVLRRMYYNELTISPQQRLDTISFQISRRCRVFGITAAGDVQDFLIELIDTSGEQYTAGPIHLTNLIGGWNPDPLAVDAPLAGTQNTNGTVAAVNTGVFVQEPNIVLAPNQTLSVNVTPANPNEQVLTHLVGLMLHVYEFPGMPGSPL